MLAILAICALAGVGGLYLVGPAVQLFQVHTWLGGMLVGLGIGAIFVIVTSVLTGWLID